MSAVSVSASPRPRVESPYLVIPTLTSLPRRCVVTNEPVDESEYRTWDLPFIPRWLVFLMFIGIFFLLTAPHVRQRCKFKAGLSRRIRRKRFWMRLPFMLLFPVAFLLVFAALVTQSQAVSVLASCTFVVAYFSLPLLVLHAHPLRIRRSRDGLYWIAGASPEFLRSLEANEVASQPAAG